jgi:hypothetical protein
MRRTKLRELTKVDWSFTFAQPPTIWRGCRSCWWVRHDDRAHPRCRTVARRKMDQCEDLLLLEPSNIHLCRQERRRTRLRGCGRRFRCALRVARPFDLRGVLETCPLKRVAEPGATRHRRSLPPLDGLRRASASTSIRRCPACRSCPRIGPCRLPRTERGTPRQPHRTCARSAVEPPA